MSGVTAALAAGGRRREALLRQGEALRQARQAAAEVARSADEQVAAARFGRLFDELCHGQERELADAVLQLLARELAREVRQALAELVAGSTPLPREAVAQAIHDEAEIARPILQHEGALGEPELRWALRTHALQHAWACAGREGLAQAIAEALGGPEEQLPARLVENAGGKLGRAALRRVAQEIEGALEPEAPPVRRPELTHELVERLIGLIGAGLEWQLVANSGMALEEARAAIAAVRERAALRFTARGHADLKLQQRLKEEHAGRRLGGEELLRYLREGDVAAVEVGLGLASGLDPGEARRRLYHPDRRGLALLCKAAGLTAAPYLALRLSLEIAEEAVSARPAGAGGFRPDGVRALRREYENLAPESLAHRALAAPS